MSQHTARHDPRAKSEDDEDVAVPQARHPSGKQGMRARRPGGRPAGDDGVTPDEPDEGEFELVGDDDLGAADLGPAAPDARDPDAGSGRIRKITSG
jgi:hypothetical protein